MVILVPKPLHQLLRLSAPLLPPSLHLGFFSSFSPKLTHNNHGQPRKVLAFYNSKIAQCGWHGDVAGAESIFGIMPVKSVVSWTALLTAYAQNGQIRLARKVFDEMPARNIVAWNAMLTAFIRCYRIEDAAGLFSRMPRRNGVSYCAMITGYVSVARFGEAERLYSSVPRGERDPAASNSLMNGYLKAGRLVDAVRIFEGMYARDVVSWSSILDGYCKEGRIEDACCVFENMPERNVVSWTSMLGGYLNCGMWIEGFDLLSRMRTGTGVRVNATTLTVICDACTDSLRLKEGMQIHGLVLLNGFEADLFLGNSIINMYSGVGLMRDADTMFCVMERKDLVSWNSILGGYAHQNNVEKAYDIFKRMPEKDVVSWTAMVVGFSRSGRMQECVSLFGHIPEKDDISWTALVSGFVQNERYEEAIWWFVEMLAEGIKPNPLTLSSVLSASAGLAVLNRGVQIHAHVVKLSLETDLSIQNALLSMYAKCGNLSAAHLVFSSIGEKNLVSMNAMITAFAQHGFANEALKLFEDMRSGCHKPNAVTFLGVLSACVHVGLVEEGLRFFEMMRFYQIEPSRDHYVCLVDLLGRAGRIREATQLISSMPFTPHSAIWGALLSASKSHMDFDMAKASAQRLIELQPDSAIPYVVLSNMYSQVGLNEEEFRLRSIPRKGRVRKNPGRSWVLM